MRARRLHLFALPLATLILASGCSDTTITEAECLQPEVAGPSEFCDDVDDLSFRMPSDIAFDPSGLAPEDVRRMFNCFSWKTFIALNWPAENGCRGIPDTSETFLESSRARVWETWKQTYELFQPQNPDWDPANQQWNEPQPPAYCSDMANGRKVIYRNGHKSPIGNPIDVDNEIGQAFATGFGVLYDQSQNLIRYEIRYNEDEFTYLRDSGWARTGSYSFGGPIGVEDIDVQFPENTQGVTGQGAIEVKASWKELTSRDDPSRYYSQEVVIFEAPTSPNEEGTCRVAQMGLVGFHINRKTATAPQWIWSTFEHMDNVPGVPGGGSAGGYTLFDPECAEPLDCFAVGLPVNTPANICCQNLELNTNLLTAFGFENTPNQTTRLIPIAANGMNDTFLPLLGDSPFRFYRLVDTQGPLNARAPDGAENFRPCNPNRTFPIPPVENDCYEQFPLHLRNTSMETYMATYADTMEQTSNDSCMNCHGAAGLDFSYIWLDAKTQIVPIQD